jgi:hypothetical protein
MTMNEIDIAGDELEQRATGGASPDEANLLLLDVAFHNAALVVSEAHSEPSTEELEEVRLLRQMLETQVWARAG